MTIPVALSYAPKWWLGAHAKKRALSILAAINEFPDASVYVQPWGVSVLMKIPAAGACDTVVRFNRLLSSAIEYKICQYSDDRDDVIEMAA